MIKKEFLLITATIYPFDILITTADDKKLFKYIERKKQYKLDDEERAGLTMRGNGKTAQLKGKQIIVRVRKEKTKIGVDLSTVVHELFHAVDFTLRSAGITFSEDSDECYAYYLSFLTKEFLLKWK